MPGEYGKIYMGPVEPVQEEGYYHDIKRAALAEEVPSEDLDYMLSSLAETDARIKDLTDQRWAIFHKIQSKIMEYQTRYEKTHQHYMDFNNQPVPAPPGKGAW